MSARSTRDGMTPASRALVFGATGRTRTRPTPRARLCGWLASATLALAWLAAPSLASAAPLSTKVTERVVDSAIDSGLEALARPQNQRRLGAILSSTALRTGMHDLAFAIVDGVFDGVREHAGPLSFDTAGFWSGFDSNARKHVAPATAVVTRAALNAALDVTLSEENGVRIEALTAHATRGLMRGLADGIRHDLAPALAYSIEHELAPAGAAAMENHLMPAISRALVAPQMQVAIATTMNAVARNLVRGGDAGIETAQAESAAAGKDGTVKIFGDRFSLGIGIAFSVAAALASVLILLAVLLVRSNRNQTRLATVSKRREAEWLALVDRLGDGDPGLDREKLRELLRQGASE